MCYSSAVKTTVYWACTCSDSQINDCLYNATVLQETLFKTKSPIFVALVLWYKRLPYNSVKYPKISFEVHQSPSGIVKACPEQAGILYHNNVFIVCKKGQRQHHLESARKQLPPLPKPRLFCHLPYFISLTVLPILLITRNTIHTLVIFRL